MGGEISAFQGEHLKGPRTDGIFTGIKIRNFYTGRNGPNVLDLEVEFSRRELEKFALFVAAKYLRE